MDYLSLLDTRYACRNYNGKLVSEQDVNYILECANKTATAFNVQNYAFGVVLNPSSFAKLIACTFGQDYIKSAGGFIIVFAKMEGLIGADTKFVADLFKDMVSIERPLAMYLDFYRMSFKDKSFKDYSIGQSNFAITNIVNAATSLGIKSNIIAGFNPKALMEAFNIDANNYYPNVIISLGYSDEAIQPKSRLALEETLVFSDK